jgi:hypothetical protein
MSSLAVDAMALYFAFALERAITLCFLLFQVTKLLPTKVQKSVVDFLSQPYSLTRSTFEISKYSVNCTQVTGTWGMHNLAYHTNHK